MLSSRGRVRWAVPLRLMMYKIVVVTTNVKRKYSVSPTPKDLPERLAGLPLQGLRKGRRWTSLRKLCGPCITIISTAWATSSGERTLAGSFELRGENSVATLPGQITLTRMPCSRKSSAMQAERPWRPHLEAQ